MTAHKWVYSFDEIELAEKATGGSWEGVPAASSAARGPTLPR